MVRIQTLKTRNVVLKLFLSLSTIPRFQCFSLSRFGSSSFLLSIFLFLVLGSLYFAMADLPPDAELWLPSDILPDDRSSSRIKPEEEEKFPSEFTYMEELAQQLSSYALLEEKQPTQTYINPSSYPTFQTPPIRIGSYEPNQTRTRVVFGGGNADIGGTSRGTGVYTAIPGGFCVQPKPVSRLPLIKPATSLVESYGGRVLQQQQNRVGVGAGNRFLPFQGNGGGNVRGTGVFLPRVETYLESRRKPGGLRHNENHCNMPVKRNSVGKKKEVGLKATSEGVDLPQEWTY